MSTVGALLTFWLGTQSALPLGEMLAVTAGMFIYIAASDLIPTIHQTFNKKYNYAAVALLIVGILTVGVTTEIAHEYIDSHTREVDSSKKVCIPDIDESNLRIDLESCRNHTHDESHH